MIKNYFTTALRTFLRQKTYSFINVAGLSVGLACSFLIFMWIKHEIMYDRFHEQGTQIYRVMRNFSANDKIYTWSSVPMPLAQVLLEEFPEITHAILITRRKHLLSKGNQAFRETGIYAGPSFFNVFTFSLLQGDARTILAEPNAIAISEKLAGKYFGPDWASQSILGQSLTVDHRKEFTIKAVFRDVQSNSSLHFEFVLPMEVYIAENKWLEHWGNSSLQLYVKLREDAVLEDVNTKIEQVLLGHYKWANATVFLQPLFDMHLYSKFKNGKLIGGDIEYVHMFTLVALFILFIACINFMNLATARSSQRAREIGVRKAVGASKWKLIGQFMGEAILIAVFASILALGLVEFFLPVFNGLTHEDLALNWLDIHILSVFSGITFVTGLISGSYPAFYFSNFNPVSVLRGSFKSGLGAVFLRRGLVIFQFALTILMVISTLTIYKQMNYILSKDLGLDRKNVVSIALEGSIKQQLETFKQELLRQPGIQSVAASSQNPLSVNHSTIDPKWDGKDPELLISFYIVNADFDFVKIMKMKMVHGRTFSVATDSSNYVVNEQMAYVMGTDNPIGETLKFWGKEGEVIGVVEDFHFSSVHTSIEPLIIRIDPASCNKLYIRTEAGQTAEALANLERICKKFNPNYPLEYRFMDEDFERMYRREKMLGQLTTTFAALAIFISCLGLFGLASFTAEQRTKEIGIRKILGASVTNLILLLSREFIKLVVIAFVLAIPLAYYFMTMWLNAFAYRINIGLEVFVLAGGASFIIAWLTVSYQAVKVASANPVDALRNE